MAQDFAESWEQKQWRFDSESYERARKLAATTKNQKVLDYATKRIHELEIKYPSLKSKGEEKQT